MGKIITLKDLKTILNNGVILQTWNEDNEDFMVVYKTDEFEHGNENFSERLWNAEVFGISAHHENEIDYTVVEIG